MEPLELFDDQDLNAEAQVALARFAHVIESRPLDPRRKENVGASEVGALFSAAWVDEAAAPDEHDPFETRFALWHRKAGKLPAEKEKAPGFKSRVFWGSMLEAAIARGVEQLTGWTVRVGSFVQHPTLEGMSASTDFLVRGPGLDAVLEVKNVDRGVFAGYGQYPGWPKRIEPGVSWWKSKSPDGGGWVPAEVQVPFRIKLQCQAQMACTGKAASITAALVGGNDLLLYRVDRHPGVIARIEAEIALFWESVRAGDPPSPDWMLDAETIAALNGAVRPDTVKNFRGDPEALALARTYHEAQKEEKEAEKRKKAAGAEIRHRLGDAERAVFDEGFNLWAGKVDGGERHFVVEPYRGFLLTQSKKGKK